MEVRESIPYPHGTQAGQRERRTVDPGIERFLFEKPKLTHVYLFTFAESQYPCGIGAIEVRPSGDIGELVQGDR